MTALVKSPLDIAVVHAPPARTSLIWSRELMQVAEWQADTGRLRLAADLCEALLGDDRIQAVLRTRVQALLGLAPTFEATSGDGRRRGRVGRALEQGEDWWALCPVEESALFLSWGLLLGVALGRLEWWEDRPWVPVPGLPGYALQDAPRLRKGRLVPTIKFWHPRFLRFDGQVNAWFATLADGREQLVTPGENGWLLFTPYGRTRPWSTAPWRGLKAWWLLKHRGIEDWDRHAEKGARLFVESAEEATPEQRRQLGGELEDAGADAVTVLPAGFKADLLEGKATGELYKSMAEAADKAAAVTLLGHANNAEPGDSNTGSTAGENLRYDLANFDAEVWGAFAHDQVLQPYAGANFGDPDLAQYPVYPIKKPDELGQRGAGYKALGEGLTALKAAEPRTDVTLIAERHDVPLLPEAPPPPPVPLPPVQDPPDGH